MPSPYLARVFLPGFLLTLAACNICGPDQRSVLTYADNGFTVTRGTRPAEATTLNSGVYERTMGSEFQALWNVFARGAQPYTGVAITFGGGSAAQLIGLVVALPTPVHDGQHVVVSGAFPPPAEPYPMYWSVWGEHRLTTPGRAEIALRVSDFAPSGGPSNPFVASTATGTIDITQTQDDGFRLQMDIVTTSSAGETVRLQGPLIVRRQSEPSTCFS